MSLNYLLKVSRPRFWIYLLGPFLVGAVASGTLNDLFIIFILGLYFTLPANLLIYGVNDIFDYETDKHNPKKTGYEALVTPKQQKQLLKIIIFLNVLPVLIIPFLPLAAQWAMVGFFFFGIFYSATPVRAKTKPLLDSLFNSLYVFPGLASYGLLTGRLPSWQIFMSAVLWCMAMHAYSAVPDITADKKAKINTVATWLGAQATILFCLACYGGAAALSFDYLGWFSILAGSLYAVLMLLSLFRPSRSDVFKLYRLFPYLNMLVGMGLFFYVRQVVK